MQITQTLCVLILAATVSGCERPADLVATTEPASGPSGPILRLQRISIPPNSKLRDKNWDDNSPPDLRIVISKNGDVIGETSEAKEGWDVEFSATKPENRYAIDGDSAATYSIALYDNDTADPDDLVLTVSGLETSAFQTPIYEPLGANDPTDRSVVFRFVPVE